MKQLTAAILVSKDSGCQKEHNHFNLEVECRGILFVIGSMADKESMPKVDFEKDKAKFKNTAVDYIKLIEKLNLERVQKLQRIRRNNIITGCVLGAIKQETFLDDFDEPATTSN
uniref:Uncharacterized protein n=1 Tax=Timema poppense TaxID=170557 RepID=A0A7R9DWZ1_TIMPO|nr:unnamed protein product [Timema poppensis]